MTLVSTLLGDIEVTHAHGYVKLVLPPRLVAAAEGDALMLTREETRKWARALSLNADAASPEASTASVRPSP